MVWTKGRVQSFVSLAISFISAGIGLVDAQAFLGATREVMDKASEHWVELSERNKDLFRSIRRSRATVIVGMVLIAYSLLLTAAKFLAGALSI